MTQTLRILLFALGAAALGIALSMFIAGPAVTVGLGEQTLGSLLGGPQTEQTVWSIAADNELRFYAPLWFAFGVLTLIAAHNPADRLVPILAAVFFAGGVGRALSWISVGTPHPFLQLLMITELAMPPILVGLWAFQPAIAHSPQGWRGRLLARK